MCRWAERFGFRSAAAGRSRWLTDRSEAPGRARRSPPCFDRWLLLQLMLALGSGPSAVGSWTCGITSSREVRGADGWHRSGTGVQTDGSMGKGSDPLTGRWPTRCSRPPWHLPCGSYRTTRSVYSSYRATVNAAFEWLFPHPSEVGRTSALRSIKIRTWKAGLVPYLCWWPR
jgi:hypothetical protein